MSGELSAIRTGDAIGALAMLASTFLSLEGARGGPAMLGIGPELLPPVRSPQLASICGCSLHLTTVWDRRLSEQARGNRFIRMIRLTALLLWFALVGLQSGLAHCALGGEPAHQPSRTAAEAHHGSGSEFDNREHSPARPDPHRTSPAACEVAAMCVLAAVAPSSFQNAAAAAPFVALIPFRSGGYASVPQHPDPPPPRLHA